MNLDQETSLRKKYILYYVDCLAYNAMVDIKAGIRIREVIQIFRESGVMLLSQREGDRGLKNQIKPLSFELWKQFMSKDRQSQCCGRCNDVDDKYMYN